MSNDEVLDNEDESKYKCYTESRRALVLNHEYGNKNTFTSYSTNSKEKRVREARFWVRTYMLWMRWGT